MKVLCFWMAATAFLIAIAGCSKTEEKTFEELTDEDRRSAEYALAGLETREGLEITLFAAGGYPQGVSFYDLFRNITSN